MNTRNYYLTTFGEWRRRAAQLANSHWVAADPRADAAVLGEATPILVLAEADEGAHAALERDPAWEALPHPLGQKPVSARVAQTLAGHGAVPGATTFEITEAVARAHPLLRHRVF